MILFSLFDVNEDFLRISVEFCAICSVLKIWMWISCIQKIKFYHSDFPHHTVDDLSTSLLDLFQRFMIIVLSSFQRISQKNKHRAFLISSKCVNRLRISRHMGKRSRPPRDSDQSYLHFMHFHQPFRRSSNSNQLQIIGKRAANNNYRRPMRSFNVAGFARRKTQLQSSIGNISHVLHNIVNKHKLEVVQQRKKMIKSSQFSEILSAVCLNPRARSFYTKSSHSWYLPFDMVILAPSHVCVYETRRWYHLFPKKKNIFFDSSLPSPFHV